ncbi:MAG: cupredoxin domain-containing protein [Pseudonocardiaceae bacterium]
MTIVRNRARSRAALAPAVLTGLAVAALGFYTLNGGLELAGSPLAASRIAHTIGLDGSPPETSTVSTADGKQVVVITTTASSYSPDNVQVRAGIPTTLVIHSDHAQGCIRSFVIASRNEQRVLPITGDTRIDLGVLRPGKLDYSCVMGMYTGTITIV